MSFSKPLQGEYVRDPDELVALVDDAEYELEKEQERNDILDGLSNSVNQAAAAAQSGNLATMTQYMSIVGRILAENTDKIDGEIYLSLQGGPATYSSITHARLALQNVQNKIDESKQYHTQKLAAANNVFEDAKKRENVLVPGRELPVANLGSGRRRGGMRRSKLDNPMKNPMTGYYPNTQPVRLPARPLAQRVRRAVEFFPADLLVPGRDIQYDRLPPGELPPFRGSGRNIPLTGSTRPW